MYYHFLFGITIETNFDLISSSSDDQWRGSRGAVAPLPPVTIF